MPALSSSACAEGLKAASEAALAEAEREDLRDMDATFNLQESTWNAAFRVGPAPT